MPRRRETGRPARSSGIPHIQLPWQAYAARLEREGVVYYLERTDGSIKIGHSCNYPGRRSTLVYRHGPLVLVAWEIGYYDVEAARHEQFAHLRIAPIPEWFEPGDELIDHVLMLRALL